MQKSGYWIGVAVLMVIGLGVAAKPGYRLFKEWRSNRVAESALGLYLENPRDPGRVQEALAKAQAALALKREGFVPNRVMGTILTSVDPSSALLYWDQALKSENLDRWTLDDQMAYIQCLIVQRRAQDADEILQRLALRYPENHEIHYNLAKTAILLGDRENALRYARLSADYPASTPEHKLMFVRLALSSKDAAMKRQGELYLERFLQRDEGLALPVLWGIYEIPDLSEAALRNLSAHVRSKISSNEETLISMAMEVRSGLIDRRHAYEQLLSGAQWELDEQRAALATWCSEHGMPEQVLQHLSIELATTHADYFLTWIKALGSLGRWQEVLDGLSHRDCPLGRFWIHYLTAEAHDALGQATGAVNQWHRAKSELPESAEAHWLLFTLADRLGLSGEGESLVSGMIALGVNPSELAAHYVGRANADGDYEGLVVRLDRLRIAAPESPDALNDWAYYAMLLSPHGNEQAQRAAEQLCNDHPTLLRYHMTWALGMIRQDRAKEVLARFQQFQLEWETLHPKWRFILALALIHAGEEAQGRHYLESIDLDRLNPIEQELLRSAMLLHS